MLTCTTECPSENATLSLNMSQFSGSEFGPISIAVTSSLDVFKLHLTISPLTFLFFNQLSISRFL